MIVLIERFPVIHGQKDIGKVNLCMSANYNQQKS